MIVIKCPDHDTVYYGDSIMMHSLAIIEIAAIVEYNLKTLPMKSSKISPIATCNIVFPFIRIYFRSDIIFVKICIYFRNDIITVIVESYMLHVIL